MADLRAERVVDVYTDGACSGNPGPGGWGVVLRYGIHEKEICGGVATATTNNRMELMAPIMALESLAKPAVVRIHTDSTYVRDGITKWLPRWKSNGWQTAAKAPVKNADLWQRLDAAASRHELQWQWVKGHAGHPENERADQLAARGLRQAREPAARSPDSTGHERLAAPDAGARTAVEVTGAGPLCRMTTRTGKRCSIAARPSGLCHVHDPAVQFGALKKNGQHCTVATGGGRCAVHRAVTDRGPGLF